MVLLKPVIKVATRPVAYLPAEFSADRCGIRIMAICRDPVRRHTGHRLGGSKARLGSGQVTVLAQHDIDQCTVTINRAIQISPLPANPDVRLIDVPAGTDSALAFAAQVLRQSRRQLRFPLPHRLVGEDEPADQEHLCQISQAQLITKSPEHNEGDDIARILRLVQDTGTALVELLAAPTAEPAVALRRPLGPFTDRPRATCRTAHLAPLPRNRHRLPEIPVGATSDRTTSMTISPVSCST